MAWSQAFAVEPQTQYQAAELIATHARLLMDAQYLLEFHASKAETPLYVKERSLEIRRYLKGLWDFLGGVAFNLFPRLPGERYDEIVSLGAEQGPWHPDSLRGFMHYKEAFNIVAGIVSEADRKRLETLQADIEVLIANSPALQALQERLNHEELWMPQAREQQWRHQ